MLCGLIGRSRLSSLQEELESFCLQAVASEVVLCLHPSLETCQPVKFEGSGLGAVYCGAVYNKGKFTGNHWDDHTCHSSCMILGVAGLVA